ncbi:MAG: hypothetical protein NC826_04035, partial [Candidatus Omnitrophica bacterium]|nr:hypothetical protein [Candidatus Omnitrophota bacterium]
MIKNKDIQKILNEILLFSLKKKIKLYLVGGYLRDFLLGIGKENRDLDFCLKRGAIKFAKELSKTIKTGFVVLDREHGCCRLVKEITGKNYTFDFTDFRGRDLGEDLLHRDFTINAFAIELENFLKHKDLLRDIIDPYSGIRDLEKRVVRLVNEESFLEDPLRILRAFSISGELGFKIDKKTVLLIKKYR